MKSWLKNHEKGSLLLLHIQPGASKTELVGEHGDRLKVKIMAQARDGEANAAVIDYFSEILKIPKKQIFLIRGESSRQKDLLLELSAEKLLILLKPFFE